MSLPSTISFASPVTGRDAGIELIHMETVLNRSTYRFSGSTNGDENHTLSNRQICQFYRTFPKRSGNSRGSAKCAIKITTDVSVPNGDGSGNIVLPIIGEVSFSMPVGVNTQLVKDIRERLCSLLGHADVPGVLFDNLTI